MFPKLRRGRLKAITKAGEQILIYHAVSKRCVVADNPDAKGKSSCHGPLYEQPGADAEGPAQHTEQRHPIPDCPRQRLPGPGEPLPYWSSPLGQDQRLSCLGGDSGSPEELCGGIWQFHCFPRLLMVCITAKRQHKVEKAHVFRVLTVYTVCHARWLNYFPFLKQRFP